MERGLVGDLAIVKAWKGDASGNLVYRKAARNFNPMMATAAKLCIAEVEELCRSASSIPTTSTRPASSSSASSGARATRRQIEQRTVRARLEEREPMAWTATRWPRAPRRN